MTDINIFLICNFELELPKTRSLYLVNETLFSSGALLFVIYKSLWTRFPPYH